MDILKCAKEKFDYTVQMRRYFHEHPESGPEEQLQTMDMIETQLEQMKIPYVRVPGGGIFGFISGAADGKTVLLRSDIDGLPIQESDCNLKGPKKCVSKIPGVMHGCGHDGHIAMLLTEGMILKELEAELKGSVILMFEQGEEGHGNVKKLCRYIQEKQMKIDTCYATHVRWDIPTGKIACCSGAALSGNYHFELKLMGKAGHGSRPDLAHNVLDCFNEIYSDMASLRLRYVRPDTSLTWSIGSVHAGSRFNMIPDELGCAGSIRMMDWDSGVEFWKEFNRIIEAVCALNYCTYELKLLENMLPAVNDPSCRKVYLNAVEKYLGKDAVYDGIPWMASESFGYMCNMYPSVESFVGIRNDELGSGSNHHTPEFDIDEVGLTSGIAAAVGYVLDFLENVPDTSEFKPICKSMDELLAMLP